jgi:phosphoserine aminotransferase
MNIPDSYRVLFLQGGAHLQFDMVPLNLFGKSKKCSLIHTGTWTKKAIEAAKKFGTVNVIASSEDKNFSYIPQAGATSADADYFYICSNNTIEGTRFTELPNTSGVPLVADMSSEILSLPLDVSKFGLIFAGAQKNIGPAGVTLVIVRKELVGHAMDITPIMLDYKVHADNRSMYNTPPTYGIYIAGLVFDWIKQEGGLAAMGEKNQKKASLLYDFIDNSSLFKGTAARKDRSLMNVPFLTGSEQLDSEFVKSAEKQGLTNLAGHRSVGGMRASIYNAMPLEGVQKLVNFMKSFEAEHK